MASYTGIISGDQTASQAQEIGFASGFVAASKTPWSEGVARTPDKYGTGLPSTRLPVDLSQARSAIRPHSFGEEQLFDRIWFEPRLIEAGFIVEDRNFNLKAWNAYSGQYADILAIETIAPEGTELEPDETPIRIQKSWDKTFTLTVKRLGPPLQNTSYRFTIGALVLELSVTGLRIVPLAIAPNWGKELSMAYSFETVLLANKRFKEQRRPLRLRPLREIEVPLLAYDVEAQKLFNQLMYGHDKVFGVPVYAEQIYTADILTGRTVFNASNDISKHWNLHRLCNYVMLADHERGQAEIKELQSVNGSTITLERPVSLDFTPERTAIYPCFFALAEPPQASDITDNLLDLQVGFKEFDDGSLPAVPAAAGLAAFPVDPDWSRQPGASLMLTRFLSSYPGTIMELGSITDKVPISVEMGLTLDKPDEYDLLEFFSAHYGRGRRFWLKAPQRAFTLKETMPSGSSVLYVERNGAQDFYEGHERIYIEMENGDLLVRRVTNIFDDQEHDRLALILDTPLDRDLTVSNHNIIGRYLLARFDIDRLSLAYKTDGLCSGIVKFYELVREYSEL